MEELGSEVEELVVLGTAHPDSGLMAQEAGLYWARIGAPKELETDEGIDELMHVDSVTLRDMITRGDVTDSFTVAEVALAQAKGLLD